MRPQRIVVLVLVALAGLALGWRLVAPSFTPAPVLSGYIESESLYLAAPIAGSVAELPVRRGQRVAAGDPLFVIEPDQLEAQRAQAAAELAAARAEAVDARKGQRPPELGVLAAEEAAAQARLAEAQATLTRAQSLVVKGIYAPARLDDAQASFHTAAASVRTAQQRLEAATLGARTDQIAAADARVRRAEAALAEIGARLADLAPVAPVAATVEEVYAQPGEWTTANQPVVSLIPDDRLFVRFFVPETAIALYRVGDTIRFSCDSCQAGLEAQITYVSSRPEFTPPVIYSREARDRLVFMVEARPQDPRRLTPGLPVDVLPLGPEPIP